MYKSICDVYFCIFFQYTAVLVCLIVGHFLAGLILTEYKSYVSIDSPWGDFILSIIFLHNFKVKCIICSL